MFISMNIFLAIFVLTNFDKLTLHGAFADQICESDTGICPADTCCRQDKCDLEGNNIKCCTASESDATCSTCPICRDCVWGEWSAPKKVSPETCGDGLQPRKRVGEVTRKYITYPDGEIKSPGGKCDDLRTKQPWEENCPEHCQLSECVWSEWEYKVNSCGRRSCTRTKINPDLPKFGGRSCEEEAGCNGRDCWQSQTENKTCGNGIGWIIFIVIVAILAVCCCCCCCKEGKNTGMKKEKIRERMNDIREKPCRLLEL